MKAILRKPYWFFRNWRFQVARAQAYLWNLRGQRSYPMLNEANFTASRRSDTLFILGSGSSVNNLTTEEWQHIAQHDTMSFNWFIHQDFVRVDYHIIRELLVAEPFNRQSWEPEVQIYISKLENNPHYRDTILLAQAGWMAITGNRLVGCRLLNPRYRILRFHNRLTDNPLPSQHLSEGIVHHLGTLSDTIQFGIIGGWKHLVFVGVDLYDRRSFWLKPDELREDYRYYEAEKSNGTGTALKEASVDTPHNTAVNGILPFMRQWYEHLIAQGLQMSVYNPHSLLAEFMPVYESETVGARHVSPYQLINDRT
jgi:hypothetical protein